MAPAQRGGWLSYLSLFSSLGTLVCCALPSLLVLLGLGSAVASLISATPWLVHISRHKAWVFAGSGALISLNYVYTHHLSRRLRPVAASCATEESDACNTADRFSLTLLWLSAGIYVVGFFVAYLLGPLLTRFAS